MIVNPTLAYIALSFSFIKVEALSPFVGVRQKEWPQSKTSRIGSLLLQQTNDNQEEWQDDENNNDDRSSLSFLEDDQELFVLEDDFEEGPLDDNDNDEDLDDVACPPPVSCNMVKRVFLLSDSTGTTVKGALQKTLVQFDQADCNDGVRLRKRTTTSSQSSTVGTMALEALLQTTDSDDENSDGSNNDCLISSRTFTFVRSEAAVASIVRKAAEYNQQGHNKNKDNNNTSKQSSNNNALILFTMADTQLRQKTMRMCELSNVRAVDLLGNTIDALSVFLNRPPKGMPQFVFNSNNTSFSRNSNGATTSSQQQRPPLSDLYYQRMEAVEYTLKADDGQSPWLLSDADIILVGVSRTGKTPLSVVLSHTLGLKVANVPLVVECPVPSQLTKSNTKNDEEDDDNNSIDPRRIFCLTVAPSELRRIRTTRLERNLGGGHGTGKKSISATASTYADRNYILRDLNHARELAETHGWTVVDVTGRAVEETASWIGEMMNERFNNCQD